MEVFLAGSWTGFIVVARRRKTNGEVVCGWNEDWDTEIHYRGANFTLRPPSNLIFACHRARPLLPRAVAPRSLQPCASPGAPSHSGEACAQSTRPTALPNRSPVRAQSVRDAKYDR